MIHNRATLLRNGRIRHSSTERNALTILQVHTKKWRIEITLDTTLYTDKSVICYIPDITLIDKNKKETYLIDDTISNNTNITQKEKEKHHEIHTISLAKEIETIWNQQTITVVLIVITTTHFTSTKFINLTTVDLHP